METRHQKRNAYARKWYRQFVEKHGVSPAVKWRRENPEAARLHREREKKRWHTNPAVRKRHREKGAEWRLQKKIAVLDAYGGCRCVCCGELEIAFLTLDHVNNDGAAHRRATGRGQGFSGMAFYSYLRARGFPKDPKLQVLCYNCNCGKRANKGVCPHQESHWE